MPVQRKTIAIVGVGLIGGSLALKLYAKKIAGRLIGVESNPLHASAALELELVDEILPLEAAMKEAEVVVLAIPVDQIAALLPAVLDLAQEQIVLDMGSTKKMVTDAADTHARRGRFVATHPMWGTEYNGPAAARHGAFEKKAVVICNGQDSDEDALAWVRSMYTRIGMHVLEMESSVHDLHAAYVSHISHITSFALANTVLEKEKEDQAIFEMASSGFESTVRLAKSHPAMWSPIFLQNRKYVLDVLAEHISQLVRFKSALEYGDERQLDALIRDANRIARILK
jgi:prephenate dehydrogenase